jgi:competence protein ComEC
MASGGIYPLPGRAHPAAPQEALRTYGRKAQALADVLKPWHHGSARQFPDFLAVVMPTVSVISVGAGNPYGHPAARTVYLAGSDGARVYCTDLDGMVLISAPASSDAPIQVQADKGDGTLATVQPSPTGSGGKNGGHSRRGGGHHHPSQHTSEP